MRLLTRLVLVNGNTEYVKLSLCSLAIKKSPMDGEMTERVKMLTTKLNGLS